MKLSMWMIADALAKYEPVVDIRNDSADITGIRFLSQDGGDILPQFVYILFSSQAEHIRLTNNGSTVTIRGVSEPDRIFNELFALFDRCDGWEKSLLEAADRRSFQAILDAAGELLDNPMMLSDMDGNVLAMSSAYRDEDINDYWVESRSSLRVPTAVLGAPMLTEDGDLHSWTDETRIYVMPDGTRTIGVYVTANGEPAAGLGLWEHKRPIRRSDIDLVNVLCGVLSSMIDTQDTEPAARSGAEIVGELLSGAKMDDGLLERLDLGCQSPWRLVVIDNPYHSDATYRRNLLGRLQKAGVSCIPLLYENRVVALVSEDDAEPLLTSVLKEEDRRYYLAAVSLPSDALRRTYIRYEQTLFSLRQARDAPGVYYGEDSMLPYILSLLNTQNTEQSLLHPALARLKRYDAEKHTELYETLYQYLLHERAILPGAAVLHIHKNSFLYRLGRIRELTGVDLDDPTQRIYLLLSFLLEKDAEQ